MDIKTFLDLAMISVVIFCIVIFIFWLVNAILIPKIRDQYFLYKWKRIIERGCKDIEPSSIWTPLPPITKLHDCFLEDLRTCHLRDRPRNNCIEEQKSLPWPNEDEKEKIINETELNRHLKSEYYFTEDFYKLIPKYQKSLLEDYTEFGQYVATELQLINKDENKEKLKTEIRKLIAEIVADDRHSLFKDFIEDEETDDVNIEE
ncbi:hypothetical protein M0802_006090 [Mischocyttarus mexicanus]|nr:hypothetical protein M0802_006090 [Mischocyttarus mexicanus]